MALFKHIKIVLIVVLVLALAACSNNDFLSVGGGEDVMVTFRPTLDGGLNTRAIGDASCIDQLIVVVYEGSPLSKKYNVSLSWDKAQANGVALSLIEGHTYKILFWAQDETNTAYSLTDDGKIQVNYDDYTTGGFAKMEELDAFFGESTVTIGTDKNEDKQITLSRPLAQLNFADNATQPVQGTHLAVVTFHGVPTSFDPFVGDVEMSDEDLTFTFGDFPSEGLSVDGSTYYYISSNYMFVPQSGTATFSAKLDFQNIDGTSIREIELPDITLEKNKKTNVLGSIVQQPETWSVWNGTDITEPNTDAQGCYVIDSASDVAWLCLNASTLSTDKTFVLTKDIDMDNKPGLSPINLPARSTFEGGEHIIKNLSLGGALFGDAINLEVNNLTIENVAISGAASHVGVMVNTLKGNSSFNNVVVNNSSVATTNGAAGGMVGYVVRKSEKDRNESLAVSFTGCKLNAVTVAGSASEGKFVGLLSGYDNKESLSFDADCDATEVSVSDYTSVYTKANNSAWVNDDVTNKYDGWLGRETYRRAKVTFGGVRLAPRWDGKTATAKADLLLYNGESNKYEVHSPFDLAGVRNATASPAALYLMENVDMFGHGTDGKFFVHEKFTKSKNASTDDNNFTAFSSIALLEGNNNGIYNLALNSNGSDRYAFILSGDNNHIHKNVSFHNCCTVVPHVVKSNEDKSYGATVVLSISGATYTMDNVHAYDCKVFALQKTGIIAGRVTSLTMATISNCSVNNCYIENYDCKDHAEAFGSGKISTTFYTPGEVGGFIGFVDNFATISNCHVRGTTIYAFGQNNKQLLIIYTVYGRHVGQFIGDIRTSDSEKDKITLTNCTVDSNTKCTKRWDKHGKCNMIGCVYSLPLLDSKGTVTLDGKSIF